MALISIQKDLVVALKRETLLNVGIISKIQPMPEDLSRHVFKENALEKPTQSLFNHLSYYLVCIIDVGASASLPWPLYDSKTERAYRNELSSFISGYSNKGLLSPVMSSYLVNPGCYKVTMLIFQMSQLTVQKLLTVKMKKDSQRKLYNDMTEMFQSKEKDGFLKVIERETERMLSKFSNYLQKRAAMEKIAELFRRKISEMEDKLNLSHAQKYLDDLVDGFIAKHNLNETAIAEIAKIKNVNRPLQFFDNWLLETDKQIDEMESKWSEKVSPFLSISKATQMQTELLISRCTGEADKNTYMIEYNHKTDFICTKDLQNQVNSQQKYILKNIIKDEKLSFPNLIRGFLVAICFILKNTEIGDEIYKFNEYLDEGRRNYSEIVPAMRDLLNRIMNAEEKLQPSPVSYGHSLSFRDIPEIPPLPDLSDLRSTRDLTCQALFDTFTPLSVSKHQFNLHRRNNFSFTRPIPKQMVTPFSHRPKDDFLKSLISCRVSSYDQPNSISHKLPVMSQNPRANETIAECSSGFTKQQILRLLSTKKSSSSKKFRYRTERPDMNIKKGGLFNESITSNESNSLFRSNSSPNLYENREKRPQSKAHRQLSIMQEDSPSLLEVSGIIALDKDNNSLITPPAKSDSLKPNTTGIPAINITTDADKQFNEMLKEFKVDMNALNETCHKIEEIKTETPKTNAQIIKKTSSLEKIINRFKKVRANIYQDKSNDDFKSIAEEKENIHIDMCTVNRVLLPDLLSPSCSVPSKTPTEYLDNVCKEMDESVRRKPRESLGTMLGVDQTFLGQFDLID